MRRFLARRRCGERLVLASKRRERLRALSGVALRVRDDVLLREARLRTRAPLLLLELGFERRHDVRFLLGPQIVVRLFFCDRRTQSRHLAAQRLLARTRGRHVLVSRLFLDSFPHQSRKNTLLAERINRLGDERREFRALGDGETQIGENVGGLFQVDAQLVGGDAKLGGGLRHSLLVLEVRRLVRRANERLAPRQKIFETALQIRLLAHHARDLGADAAGHLSSLLARVDFEQV
mmetsp:Transcript_10552/g.44920  ORF Transcript_10552/g.44920 Transcript_10552/m.44920 type:complete len:235 (+) Transcript_10552:369-1073(+)